jgi:4-hydroxybenzoyl-CoA thioesterase/acyl-CoA thioester hydrolase
MPDSDRDVEFPVSEIYTSRRVEFADTDMGGIVHFSRFFIFMETAEHELLRVLGAEVHMEIDGLHIGWPRVEAKCRYFSPARFGDVLQIRVRILKISRRSMSYEMTFTVDGEPIARGQTTSVCCVMDDPEGLRPIPIPTSIADKIAESKDSSETAT